MVGRWTSITTTGAIGHALAMGRTRLLKDVIDQGLKTLFLWVCAQGLDLEKVMEARPFQVCLYLTDLAGQNF
jgi:hypothetical protein